MDKAAMRSDPDHKLFWGETHTNIHSDQIESLPCILEAAGEMLDFWPVAYYPHTQVERGGFHYEDWQAPDLLHCEWQAICDVAARN